MADTAIQFLLDNLSQLLIHHANLISGVAEDVNQLVGDLKYFNAILEYASKKRIVEKTKLEFVRQIRDVVYEAEDVVDAFYTQILVKRAQSWFRKFTFGTIIKLDGIAQKVNDLRVQIEKKYGNHEAIEKQLKEIGDDPNEKIEVAKVREKNVVGLETETEDIVEILKQDTPYVDIISIIGMPGLGKSTLAWKIFQDSRVQYEFPTRIWVNVSKFPRKDVFLKILEEFTQVTQDMRSMKEHELAPKVKRYLENGKFFIVMDDVWEAEEWSNISDALPDTNYQLKVLITSRHKEVAQCANPRKERPPYNLKLLELKHSVKLLQYEVFGEPRWDPDFEDGGKDIADKCKGLPLAIVVTGGIISKKLSTITEHRLRVSAWEKFADKVPEYLIDDPRGTMEKVISLSYEKLPYHMKHCFLYFGMFPEDMEIPAWKLLQMWIAEGFIPKNRNFTLEQTAESYLDDLINRNLIMIGKRSSNGAVKTCRIHDSLRDFCKKKASDDDFLEEIRRSAEGNLEPVVSNNTNYHRLCIHSNVSEFLASKPHGRKVRSFACFSKDGFDLEATHVSAIPTGFKMLRVLDVKPVRFPKIGSATFELLHLRYVHLSFNSKILPEKFSNFWNMQTLIVETPERTLEIKADIWKMRNLRHLKTSATARLPEPTNTAVQAENNIQTLGTISPEDCTKRVLGRARNLRRLKIRGRLEMLLRSSETEGSFDNIAELGKLEQLKLENSVSDKPASEAPLPRLPPSEKFPTWLRILTLKYTYLDWSQMRNLASLDHLEVLNLKERAFIGNEWKTGDGGFPRLKVLFIGRTNLTAWKVSAGIFPSLMHLELDNCDDLRYVPIEFANRPSLRVLTLNYCRSAAPSTEEIKRLKAADFQVNVFPPLTSDQSSVVNGSQNQSASQQIVSGKS